MGPSSQDLAGALLIIFKTNSSVTGSKISKAFPAKEISGQAVGFGELFLMAVIFSVLLEFINITEDGVNGPVAALLNRLQA